MKNAVEVEGLSKKYTIGEKERYLVLSEILVKLAKAPLNLLKGKGFKKKSTFWALKDVNFTIKTGEVVGIIGRNGAGKSTLLKVLSRITEPTDGVVKMNGRVSSLLEVGTGFHPELTGRENIYLNGAILGMSRKEIDKKFDEIVEFSGVEKFLDMPVKRYSSGMMVRLAFSVAAHLEPDILIIDEVLAVGDAEFQKKCLGKMDEVTKSGGRTVIFVSHDMGAVRRVCTRGLVMVDGKVSYDGPIQKAIEVYYKSGAVNNPSITFSSKDNDKEIVFKRATTTDSKGKKTSYYNYGEVINLDVDIECKVDVKGAVIGFELHNAEGVCIISSSHLDKSGNIGSIVQKGNHSFRIQLDTKQLTRPGSFFLKFSCAVPKVRHVAQPSEMVSFEVNASSQLPSYRVGHGRRGVIESVIEWKENNKS